MEDRKRLKKMDDCWGIGYAKYRRIPGGVERREKISNSHQRVSSTSDISITWKVEELN